MKIRKKTPKEKILKIGKECDRTGNCCRHGSGTIIEGEAEKISNHLGITQEKFQAEYTEPQEKFNTKRKRLRQKKMGKPYGPCIFFKGNSCTIHEVKPLHCRVGNCKKHGWELSQWFTLNYFVNPDDLESIRQWAGYLKINKTIPGGELDELVPDKKMLKRILCYDIIQGGK